MNEQILTTPAVATAEALLKECWATRSIGAIIGANGSGKTFALRALELRYPKLGLPGTCLRYRCCQLQGVTRGVRDVLLHLGGRLASLRSGATGGLQLFSKMAKTEFTKRDIQTLLLDEADLWDIGALSGLVTFYDLMADAGHPLVLIITGIAPSAQWLDQLSSLRSRTLRIEMVPPLSKELLLAVLQEWAQPFRNLAEKVNGGIAASEKLLKRIERGTEGNLRRARQFTDLLLMAGPDFSLTEESVAAAFAKMLQNV